MFAKSLSILLAAAAVTAHPTEPTTLPAPGPRPTTLPAPIPEVSQSDVWGQESDVYISRCALRDLNACSGHGRCIDGVKNDVGYTCSCNPGWTGEFCEEIIPNYMFCRTKDTPCSGHGSCIDGVKNDVGYICSCNANYYGEFCEYARMQNICDLKDVKCNGHGECISGEDYYACNCEEGYLGNDCEYSLLDTLDGSCVYDEYECVNGGECTMITKINGDEAYMCKCPEGTSGKYCQTK